VGGGGGMYNIFGYRVTELWWCFIFGVLGVPAKIQEKMAAGFRANTTNPLKIRKVQVTVLWTVLWINTAKLPPIFPSTPPLDIGDRSSLPD
jgi:hypothetical protein